MDPHTVDVEALPAVNEADRVRPEALAAGASSPEERVYRLAERASEILARWTAAGERHERAVTQLEAQLSDLEAASTRMQREASQKLEQLERVVEHEWTALRQVHEEPVRQLREQANSLTEVSIATAHSAQRGFDLAEARLASIEAEMGQRIAELRREMQMVVGELRAGNGQARIGASPPAWPLDGVTRLHQQLRQGSPAADGPIEPPRVEREVGSLSSGDVIETSSLARPVPPASPMPPAPAPSARANAAVDDRLRAIERALEERAARPPLVDDDRGPVSIVRRVWPVAAVLIALLGMLAWWVQSRVASQIAEADRRSQEAAEQANETRALAEQEITAAREAAVRAQTIGAVLSAPDALRFNLAAVGTFTGSAQALWSPTRGFVLSGSLMRPPPEGEVYQAWVLARGRAISVGTFTPDAAGSVTMVVDTPPTSLPVISVVVSLEPAGGSQQPDGLPVLVRTRVQ